MLKNTSDKERSVIEKVKELNFPIGQYVVVASGTLDALGIRKASDVDIAVLPELHKKLCENPEWEQLEKYGKIFLKKEGVDIIPSLDWSEYLTTTEEAIASALIIDGIPFLNLQELKKFKRAMGRDKDFEDIKLIDDYLLNKK
ncbi:MAG: hypothetical protein WCW78_04040 [Candidatus Paceibacterota bacterium]|jgi:hypothetical protein